MKEKIVFEKVLNFKLKTIPQNYILKIKTQKLDENKIGCQFKIVDNNLQIKNYFKFNKKIIINQNLSNQPSPSQTNTKTSTNFNFNQTKNNEEEKNIIYFKKDIVFNIDSEEEISNLKNYIFEEFDKKISEEDLKSITDFIIKEVKNKIKNFLELEFNPLVEKPIFKNSIILKFNNGYKLFYLTIRTQKLNAAKTNLWFEIMENSFKTNNCFKFNKRVIVNQNLQSTTQCLNKSSQLNLNLNNEFKKNNLNKLLKEINKKIKVLQKDRETIINNFKNNPKEQNEKLKDQKNKIEKFTKELKEITSNYVFLKNQDYVENETNQPNENELKSKNQLKKLFEEIKLAYLKYYIKEKNSFLKVYSENLNKIIKIIKQQNPNISNKQIFNNKVFFQDLEYKNKIENLKKILTLTQSYNTIKNLIKNSTNEENLTEEELNKEKLNKKDIEYITSLLISKLLNLNKFEKEFKNLEKHENKAKLINSFKQFEEYFNAYGDILNFFIKASKLKINGNQQKEEFKINFYKTILKDINFSNNSDCENFEEIYKNFYNVYSNLNLNRKNFFEFNNMLNLAKKNAFKNILGGKFSENILENLTICEKDEKKFEVYLALLFFIKKLEKQNYEEYIQLQENLKNDILDANLHRKFLDVVQLWETDTQFCNLKQSFETNFLNFNSIVKHKNENEKTQNLSILENFDFTTYQKIALNALKLLAYKPNFSIKFFSKFRDQKIYNKDYFKSFIQNILNLFQQITIKTTNITELVANSINFLTNEKKSLKTPKEIIEITFKINPYKKENLDDELNLNYKKCENNFEEKINNLKEFTYLILDFVPNYLEELNKACENYSECLKNKYDNEIILKEKIVTILNNLDLLIKILKIENNKNKVILNNMQDPIVDKIRRNVFNSDSPAFKNNVKYKNLNSSAIFSNYCAEIENLIFKILKIDSNKKNILDEIKKWENFCKEIKI